MTLRVIYFTLLAATALLIGCDVPNTGGAQGNPVPAAATAKMITVDAYAIRQDAMRGYETSCSVALRLTNGTDDHLNELTLRDTGGGPIFALITVAGAITDHFGSVDANTSIEGEGRFSDTLVAAPATSANAPLDRRPCAAKLRPYLDVMRTAKAGRCAIDGVSEGECQQRVRVVVSMSEADLTSIEATEAAAIKQADGQPTP